MKLNSDFNTAMNTAGGQLAFKSLLIADVASTLSISQSRIAVTNLQSGSIIATTIIEEKAGEKSISVIQNYFSVTSAATIAQVIYRTLFFYLGLLEFLLVIYLFIF
jgi:hypothetical protein